MNSLFTNGKARITRLVIFELLCGICIMVLGQLLANLPSQSWLSQQQIAKICFVLGTLQVLIKGLELFFNKTVALFQNYDQKQETEIADTVSVTQTVKVTPPENKTN